MGIRRHTRPPSPPGKLASGLSLSGIGLVLLTHVGYPVAAHAVARAARRARRDDPAATASADRQPTVTVLIPAYLLRIC